MVVSEMRPTFMGFTAGLPVAVIDMQDYRTLADGVAQPLEFSA
ncbi:MULTISPECIES: hypothetical protein [Burkholderia cepacia complex]|nr:MULTISPECIES: hypothetical protein [Burkholderia cepacia complex]